MAGLLILNVCFQPNVKMKITSVQNGPRKANVQKTGNLWNRSAGEVVQIVVSHAG